MSHKRPTPFQQPSLPGLFTPQKSRRLSTPHDQALEVAHGRLLFASLVFVMAYLGIALGLTCRTMASEPSPEVAHNPSPVSGISRADITDRNGTVLATSLPTVSLCADAKKIENPDELGKQLSAILPDLDVDKLKQDLSDPHHANNHCISVRRHLTPKQYYAVNSLGIVGLDFLPDERRIYPAENVTAHVVGYTDIDNNGLAGIEKKFDEKLQDEPLALSVDLRLQTLMHDQLAGAIDNFHAIGGAGLIMDISTGEILSLVSLPDFDPEHPGDPTDASHLNRDTLGVYEMGSTFKIFNTALALESGQHIGDTFDTVHPIEIGGQLIRDFEPEKRWLNVAEIFTHSSNIGAAHMADRIGGAKQRAFLAKLGLMEKSDIELPEVGAPLVPTAKDWGEATTMTAAFGHGIAVNVVQLAAAVATIVNNGVPVHPTILKQNGPRPVQEAAVISPRTSAMMRGLMRLVVTRGTAKGSNVEGYLLGGKTGTADKLAANHKYNAKARLSSFVGIFPANAPKYLVFAMLDDPKGNAKTAGFATGGWTAAPVVSRVVAQMGPLMQMQPLPVDAEAVAERQVLKPLGAQILDGMPIEEGPNYASVESDSVQ